MDTQETIQKVGDAFVAILREWLTPDEFAEMRRANATPDYQNGCCASHDFCDANMAMMPAFEKVTGREFNHEATDADYALWNAAWDYARAKYLLAQPMQHYTDTLNNTPTTELSDDLMERVYCAAMADAGRDEDLMTLWRALPDVRPDEIAFLDAYDAAFERMHAGH